MRVLDLFSGIGGFSLGLERAGMRTVAFCCVSDSWFVRHRQEWIGETVRIFGFINREHIEKKFQVSTPQASIDIQRFIDANPGVMTYNRSAKRYEAA